MKLLLIVALATFTVSESKEDPLNILAILPYNGKSHFFVFRPYLEELAIRGHNVTVISFFPRESPLKNYHDISLAGTGKIIENVFKVSRSYLTVIGDGIFIYRVGVENCKSLLNNKNVQNLWKSNFKFDVVVVEQFNSDCALGVAYKLGAPVVALTSTSLLPWQYDRIGVPCNPSFAPSVFFGGGTHPSLYDRIERTIVHTLARFVYQIIVKPSDEKVMAEYIEGVPPMDELARNIKVTLIYTNFILFGSRLLPANVIEVGGYHVAKPKPLTDDIKKFMDESEDGVIYVSFGSMLQSSTTPDYVVEAITHVISSLPQRVVWKWDGEIPSGNRKNIFASKWLPQNDILAHPKVVAFYSHCGLLSTTEAIYHAVPIVGMPVFGDQVSNAAAIEESGFGVQINIYEVTKENLLNKFKTILQPAFRKRVKDLSRAWHDRPLPAMDSAVYWTEYVAKHPEVNFLSASAEVPFYQYYSLDVLSILLVFVILLLIVFKFIMSSIISLMFKQKVSVQDKKRKAQ